jgi:hypothetical protein
MACGQGEEQAALDVLYGLCYPLVRAVQQEKKGTDTFALNPFAFNICLFRYLNKLSAPTTKSSFL